MFTFSIHGAKNYPFRKEASDLDVELPDGAGDDEYLAALARAPAGGARSAASGRWSSIWLAPIRTRAIDSGGCGSRWRDWPPATLLVFDACRAAPVPVAVVMSGGYAPEVDDIVAIHLHTVRAAAGLAAAWPRRTLA